MKVRQRESAPYLPSESAPRVLRHTANSSTAAIAVATVALGGVLLGYAIIANASATKLQEQLREHSARLEAIAVEVSKQDLRLTELEAKPAPVQAPASPEEPATAVKPATAPKAKAPASKAPVKTSAAKSNIYTITFYCPCATCCGKADGITASGTKATAGRTIAAPKSFAFGTQLHVIGLGSYVVEDRGGSIKGNRLDIYVDSHEEALRLGKQQREVVIAHD